MKEGGNQIYVKPEITVELTPKAIELTKGHSPSVSINENNICACFYSAPGGSQVYYKVGRFVDRGNVVWGTQFLFYVGASSFSVALSHDNKVLVLYETNSVLNYRCGDVNVETLEVSWGSFNYLNVGRKPSVSINSQDIICAAFEDGEELKYVVGKLQSKGKPIWWGGFEKFSAGKNPSISVNIFGHVLVSHSFLKGDNFW